ncbi:LmrA/YxaF family transcription factor [Lysinibacillus xylanilyticus]
MFRATEGMRQEMDNLLSAHDNVIDAIDHLFEFYEEIDVKAESDGIPLALIAMETALISERIRIACRDAYTLFISMLADKFVASNWPRQAADEISSLIFAIIQGNGIAAMTQLSNEPFKLAHKQVMEIIRNKEKELDLDEPTGAN